MSIGSDPSFELPVTGSLSSLNSSVLLVGNKQNMDVVTITGTWSGTISFQGSADGAIWVPIDAINSSNRARVQSTVSNGTFLLISTGYYDTRVVMTSYSSGTALISNYGSDTTSVVYGLQADTWTVNIGTSSLATEATLSALNSKFNQDFGASSGAVRVAALLGNASGIAAFGAGTTNAQTLRVVLPTDQTAIPITGNVTANVTSISTQDIFANNVVGSRYNQVEVHFDEAFDTNLITNTVTGTGTATQSNGHALFSTGTGTTSSAKGVSVSNISYRSGHEAYAFFSAAFTTPTSANSYQRIGLYDTNNGFFVGYTGTTFGVTLRSNAVDTFIPNSSWNGDLLNGSINSTFTRNGTPEAINFSYSNVFRIRFGWLGSAQIKFEVYSPDGQWVVFHTIKIPNSQLNPSIQNPDLPMTVHANKASADATNLTVYTGCWGAGVTSNLIRLNDSLSDYSLAGLTRSVIVGRTTAGGSGYVNVKVNPSGALTVAATQDGTWTTRIQDSNGNNVLATNNQLNTRDVVNTTFLAGTISVGTTPVIAKVGASPLSNRKYLLVQPLNGTVYKGSSSSITSSSNSAPVFKNQVEVRTFTDNVNNLYLVAATGTVNVYIEEGS